MGLLRFSCFYFRNPLTLETIFFMMSYYCLNIWSIQEAKEPVLFFIVCQVIMRYTKLIFRRVVYFSQSLLINTFQTMGIKKLGHSILSLFDLTLVITDTLLANL